MAEATVATIMQPCSAATAIAPDADAMEVLTSMSRTQNSRYLVTEGERLVGVITLKDMLKFLSVKLDLEESEQVDLSAIGTGRQPRDLGRQT